MANDLAARVRGPVFEPRDPGFAPELRAFNLATVHAPDLVVGVRDEADVVAAVGFARERGMAIAVQGAGHGAYEPMRGGLAITTKRIDHVRLDPATRIATIGAGARWDAVIAAGAVHGLAPIAGSSPTVGVVGYLLGGGLGPLARSHGFSSDYLVGARVVTCAGAIVDTGDDPELLWALRGGKPGFGIVTEVRVQLVALATLYGGALVFGGSADVEAALRGWLAWTRTADPRVTTSVAIGSPPGIGYSLALRFAFPGDGAEGARLAAPLRALAPIQIDRLDVMRAADIATIGNDPTQPLEAWTTANMVARADDALATIVLAHFGEAAGSPFAGFELRHIGAATERDVPGGSAVGGRAAHYTFGLVGIDPAQFAAMPTAADRLFAATADYLATEGNINFTGPPHTPAHHARAWSPQMRTRLDGIRRRYGV